MIAFSIRSLICSSAKKRSSFSWSICNATAALSALDNSISDSFSRNSARCSSSVSCASAIDSARVTSRFWRFSWSSASEPVNPSMPSVSHACGVSRSAIPESSPWEASFQTRSGVAGSVIEIGNSGDRACALIVASPMVVPRTARRSERAGVFDDFISTP